MNIDFHRPNIESSMLEGLLKILTAPTTTYY